MENSNKLKDDSFHYLKELGVVNSRITHEESLRSGFIFASWTKAELTEVHQLDFLKTVLKKINVKLEDIAEHENNSEKFEKMKQLFSKENKGMDIWFKVGLWTFLYTWVLGHDNFTRDTETARNLIRHDNNLRTTGSHFNTSLLELGWSPDKIETFNLDKMIPFLYEEGLRKWVGNPDMAVMSDLRYEARQLDNEIITDTKKKRTLSAIRKLISAIPFVGEAISVLLFGNKHKE